MFRNYCKQEEKALSLNGKKKNFTLNDFLKFGTYCEIDEKLCILLIDKMLQNLNKWIEIISNSCLNKEQKEKYINFIKERCTSFK